MLFVSYFIDIANHESLFDDRNSLFIFIVLGYMKENILYITKDSQSTIWKVIFGECWFHAISLSLILDIDVDSICEMREITLSLGEEVNSVSKLAGSVLESFKGSLFLHNVYTYFV